MDDKRDLRMRLMLEAEKELTKDMSEVQRYQYYLGRMQFLHYTSGKENLLEADCSGSVCLALLLATGCSIRVTADALYRKFFTKRNPDKNDIQAVSLFLTMTDDLAAGFIKKENARMWQALPELMLS